MLESEISLLRRFANKGDAEAFSEIVHRHAGLVYGACLRVLEDKTKAADVVQETFFQLYKDAGHITGSVSSWLHSVATRKAVDVIRKDSRRKRREAKYAVERLREAESWEDISTYIDEGLDELDDETRQILIQRFFEGRSMADIAGGMDISQPTVSRRVESGVSKLRETLRKRGVIVAGVALVSLLTENAVKATPALVMKELGKIALLGSTAVSSGAGTAATGVLTGVKVKIITAAAVTAVGVGGIVTYKQVTAPAEKPENTVVQEIEQPEHHGPAGTSEQGHGSAEIVRIEQQPPKVAVDNKQDENITSSGRGKVSTEAGAPAGFGAVRGGRGYGGGYGSRGGFGGRFATPPKEKEEPDSEDSNSTEDSNSSPPLRFGGGYGGGG